MTALLPATFENAQGFRSQVDLPFGDREYTKVEGALYLQGLTCLHAARHGNEMISMILDNGSFAVMHHHQDCCEQVWIEDINGELDDLLGTPILVAEERAQDDPNAGESGTWTFYCFRTIKGSIDIRWYGASNGFYSEAVSFELRRPLIPLAQHERIFFTQKVAEWRRHQGLRPAT